MRSIFSLLVLVAPLFGAEPKRTDAPPPPEGFPKFEVQEIETGLKIGYAVIATDLDGDKKLDIVVLDQHKVAWYQNPGWKKRVLLDGKTKADNVCIAAADLTGDGLPELIVGAGWKPFDTKTPGTLQWLKRGKTLDDEWSLHAIPCDEPTVHRIRIADLDLDGKPELILAPLMGREATKEKNWTDGRPVRILQYPLPKEPEKAENWVPSVLSEDLHVVHNFDIGPEGGYARKGRPLIVGSYEGLNIVYPEGQGTKWTTLTMHEANQADPKGSRGVSEVKASEKSAALYATVEPWHGNQIVAYTPKRRPDPEKAFNLERTVIDDQLRWGHAIQFADVDGDGSEEIIASVRDNPDPKQGDKFTEKRGVRIYRFEAKSKSWNRYVLEDGGVAVEDLAVADLDADGKPDIIAVGRATGNCRIYWNKGK